MLALTAYLCAGWWGLVMGSILLGLCPPLLTYSHYMKEDTSLLVGMAMTVLASRSGLDDASLVRPHPGVGLAGRRLCSGRLGQVRRRDGDRPCRCC